MTISLSQMIADLNAKIAAADSNTPIATILEYATEAERLGGGKIIYDSSGVLPSDSAYEGMIAYVADSATLKVRGDYGWAGIADSASVTPPYTFQGSVSGYNSGGATVPTTDTIDKFPFAADANATDVGNLTVARRNVAGQSSSVSGYSSGGSPFTNKIIDKFSFAADANATDVGDQTVGRYKSAGQSSADNGYTSGGSPPTPSSNIIDKFSFTSDGNATDVGDLTVARNYIAGQSSSVSGYSSGGETSPANAIDKFPFSVDANATDVGDLTVIRYGSAGQSSSVSGYNSGGYPTPGGAYSALNTIDKFPFSSDANATDVGDLTLARYYPTGQSSVDNGYTSGGVTVNTIDKFPFATDTNASDVGDLTVARFGTAGQQV